jgi:hypothetical protein
MKKTVLFSGIFSLLLIISSGAHAAARFTCQSTTGSNRSLFLYIINHDLVQVRAAIGNARPRAIPVKKLLTQNIPGTTQYTVAGNQILIIENSIIEEQNGNASLLDDSFSCSI